MAIAFNAQLAIIIYGLAQSSCIRTQSLLDDVFTGCLPQYFSHYVRI